MQYLQHILDIILYYRILLLFLALLVAAIAVYRRGSHVNLLLVKEYMGVFEPSVKSLFPVFDNKVVQESANVLKVYAEGRKTCMFAIFGFAMVPRQQMLSFLLNDLVFVRKDQLVLEIPIRNESPPLFACAVFKRSYLKSITKKKYPDLKNHCKQQQTSLPKNLMVIAESKDLLPLIINQKTLSTWAENSHLIKIFYVSDNNKLSKLVLELKPRAVESVPALLEMVVGIVDRLAGVKMSESTRNHIVKRRGEVEL